MSANIKENTACKFNIAPENSSSQKRKVVFQPSFFRGYVKLQACICSCQENIVNCAMPFEPAMVVHIVLRPIALRPKKMVKKTCCFLLGVCNGKQCGAKCFNKVYSYILYNHMKCKDISSQLLYKTLPLISQLSLKSYVTIS